MIALEQEGPYTVGDYVEAFDSGTWERGIVRSVSGDLRIIYVQLEGEADPFRYSPDEVRYHVASQENGGAR